MEQTEVGQDKAKVVKHIYFRKDQSLEERSATLGQDDQRMSLIVLVEIASPKRQSANIARRDNNGLTQNRSRQGRG
jgi:hypothetical protein